MRGSRFHETYPVTSFLLLFNLAFFLLQVIQTVKVTGEMPRLLGGSIPPSVAHLLGSLSLRGIEAGQYWRLLAAAFLHADFLHIFMNMAILLDLGRFAEPLLSSWKFLVVYITSALGAGAASLIYGATAGHPMRSSVGASGAISGLIGALLVHSIKERKIEMRDSLARWVLLMVVFSFLVPHLDHAGHIGGFLTGAVFGLTIRDYIRSSEAARWRYPGAAAALLGAGCLGMALWNYFLRR